MATSTLNPNAPIFVPSAYRAVEDFSDQWWDLIRNSPWFRDYWLRECYADVDSSFPDLDDFDIDFDFSGFDSDPFADGTVRDSGNTEQEETKTDLVTLGALKWQKPRAAAEIPKYGKKAPKIVNVKVSPRPIQQPR
ncbi:PREDICTED: protein EARLY RESPONSIVE TO DEHYDRATION 15-like [Ipomoea nil]|uniref:protein EARLY RESPONSIVE TO DEHYDRATION 15-like n=1 Tax=Ipomoea nil TaxID=35883 RepID=UPI00090117D0|nr:PREDICTED: protein EARLY RESPONSIVE TO DEHYDRATION 15-like [Ipomoea nil]